MNRYILIRRVKGPAVLLLIGVIALLHQADLASWNLFLPLLLILIGVLKLAERAALAAAGDEALYPGMQLGAYPGSYPGPYPGAPVSYGTASQPGPTAAEAPAAPKDLNGPQGGQS